MRKDSILLIAGTAVVGFLVFAAGQPIAAQETYPTRPVLLTHGFAAGGNGDVVSRIVADALSSRLGQPVIVEPRPGAGGNTASARLAKAEPDGYTLISLTGGHAVSAAIYKSLPFDPLDDFQMVSVYGYQGFMIAVRKDSPIASMADLIAAAKSAPGKLTRDGRGGDDACALSRRHRSNDRSAGQADRSVGRYDHGHRAAGEVRHCPRARRD